MELISRGERTKLQEEELRVTTNKIREEQARFHKQAKPVTLQTKNQPLISQLNYFKQMQDVLTLQICIEDDFIYQNVGDQRYQKLINESFMRQKALQDKLNELIGSSKETLKEIKTCKDPDKMTVLEQRIQD